LLWLDDAGLRKQAHFLGPFLDLTFDDLRPASFWDLPFFLELSGEDLGLSFLVALRDLFGGDVRRSHSGHLHGSFLKEWLHLLTSCVRVALRADEDRDLATQVNVARHAARLHTDALPTTHGDVLTKTPHERRAIVLNRAASAGERLGTQIGTFARLFGSFDDLVHESKKILVSSSEVRLNVHLNDDRALFVGRNLRRNNALCGHLTGALGALGKALLEDDLDGLVHIAL